MTAIFLIFPALAGSPECVGADWVAASHCEDAACVDAAIGSVCASAVDALQLCVAASDASSNDEALAACAATCAEALGVAACAEPDQGHRLLALPRGLCAGRPVHGMGARLGRAEVLDRLGTACGEALETFTAGCRGTWDLTPAQRAIMDEEGYPPSDAVMTVSDACRTDCARLFGPEDCYGDWQRMQERIVEWEFALEPPRPPGDQLRLEAISGLLETPSPGAWTADLLAEQPDLSELDAIGRRGGSSGGVGGGAGTLRTGSVVAPAPRSAPGISLALSGRFSRLAAGGDTACVAQGAEVRCVGEDGRSFRWTLSGPVVALAVGRLGIVAAASEREIVIRSPRVALPDRIDRRGVTGVAVGDDAVCAVAGGRVLCAGANDRGQLGDGTDLARSGAVEVHGIDDAREVVLGSGWACALRSTGEAACWGDLVALGEDAPRGIPTLVSSPAIEAARRSPCEIRGGVVACTTGGPPTPVAGTAVALGGRRGWALTDAGLVSWPMDR